MSSTLRRHGPAILAFVSAVLVGEQAAAQESFAHDWQLGLASPASTMMENMRDFHTFLLAIITVIVLLVMALLGYCVVRYNSRRNPLPARTTHNTLVEIAWTVIPVLVLVAIAIPSFRLLYHQQVIPVADLTVKAVGHQWYWSYEYPDHGGFSYDSLMIPESELQPGQPRLLAVDNEMIVPVDRTVRLVTTAADVLHAVSLPPFGLKVDAVPGRLNEAWFRATVPGIYYGQCSELCGRDHAFMPLAVRVVPQAEFEAWVVQARQRFASTGPERGPVLAKASR